MLEALHNFCLASPTSKCSPNFMKFQTMTWGPKIKAKEGKGKGRCLLFSGLEGK